jgi:glycosyltransferase involved in cell wall biosynthesis
MTSLLVRELPASIETHKDADPNGVWILGSAIAEAALVQSLLRYGRYDRYYFLWPAAGTRERAQQRLREYPHAERTALIGVDDLAAIAGRERLVLLTESALIDRLLPLRQGCTRAAWPVTGFTHAFSARQCLPESLMLLLGEVYEHDSLICTSTAAKRALQNVFTQLADDLHRRFNLTAAFRGRLPVLPFGTDASSIREEDAGACRDRMGIPRDAVVFLSLGRFSPAYKADLCPLILQFAEIARDVEDVVLVLAGDDTQHRLAPHLAAWTCALGIADRVIIRPNVTRTDKACLYDAADAFIAIADSVQETFGLTLIEAMAHGLPIIASDWDGYRDTVEHGRTGFLVPTYWDASTIDPVTCGVMDDGTAHWLLGQSVCVDWRSFRQHLIAIRESPDLRRCLSENARRRALARYDWPVVIRQYEDLWDEQLTAGESLFDAHPSTHLNIGRGLHEFDRRSIFAHYATECAGAADVTMLRMTELGARFVAGESPGAMLDGGLDRAMAAIAESGAIGEDGRTIEMRALVARLDTHPADSGGRISRNIVRLIKYGLLERVC